MPVCLHHTSWVSSEHRTVIDSHVGAPLLRPFPLQPFAPPKKKQAWETTGSQAFVGVHKTKHTQNVHYIL